ncbi:MAG: Uma2 family endonuclease [Chloroflexi bacterium]|nr:Uma2 family endonuclease [Chloroflexota bacterium]
MALRKPSGTPVPANRRFTAADYFAMPYTPERYEVIEGVLHRMPSPTFEHQDIALELCIALKQYSARAGGRVGIAPLDVELDEHNVLQPDVIYIAPDQLAIASDHVHGAPALIVEVTSPSMRKYDANEKLPAYARLGVREAWVVDPKRRTVAVYSATDGRFGPPLTVAFGQPIPSGIVEVGDGGLGALG